MKGNDKANTKIRVGLFISGHDGGGVRTSLLNIIRHIDRTQYDLFVIACDHGPFLEEVKQWGIPAAVLGSPLPTAVKANGDREFAGMSWHSALEGIRWMASVFPRLRQVTTDLRLDLLHSHRIHFDLLGGVASKLTGIPSVWHLRGMLNRRSLNGMAVPVFSAAAALLGSAVIANSSAVRETLMACARKKTTVVYNGLPIDQIRSHQEKREYWQTLGVPPGVPIVGLIARINPNKGQEFFVRAATRVLRDRDDVRFIIVGGMAPGQEHYLRQLHQSIAENGLAERVLFAGHVQSAHRLMSTFDIFAFCTQHAEACPNTIIEAMAAGVPVVATAVGGAGELVLEGRTGFLVPAGDETSFAQKLLWLLANPEAKKQFGHNGFLRATESFSIQEMIANLQQIYTQACRG